MFVLLPTGSASIGNDDWKMSSRLTWNLGLRYEPYTAPSEKWGRVSVVKDWLTATHYDTGGTMFFGTS